MSADGFVFAYGSLVRDRKGPLATLPRHRRVWGVATDNVRHIPGYKMYLDRSDGSRPDIYVAFVDIEPDGNAEVNGIVTPVTGAELDELDLRERNYDRVEVTELIEEDFGGRVWTYRGSAEGRARLEQGRQENRAVVSRDYSEKLHGAFRGLGDAEYRRFLDSSDLDGLPLRDLERVDL